MATGDSTPLRAAHRWFAPHKLAHALHTTLHTPAPHPHTFPTHTHDLHTLFTLHTTRIYTYLPLHTSFAPTHTHTTHAATRTCTLPARCTLTHTHTPTPPQIWISSLPSDTFFWRSPAPSTLNAFPRKKITRGFEHRAGCCARWRGITRARTTAAGVGPGDCSATDGTGAPVVEDGTTGDNVSFALLAIYSTPSHCTAFSAHRCLYHLATPQACASVVNGILSASPRVLCAILL